MNRILSKDHRKSLLTSQSGLTSKHTSLIILSITIIAAVILLSVFALNLIEDKIKADTGEALQILLKTTHESLRFWVEREKYELSQMAENPLLVPLVERQLGVTRSQTDLSEKGVLSELREFFLQHKDQHGQAGFFIIAKDFVNIAAIDDSHIGIKNPIAYLALGFLNRAFQGETVMVPPIWSKLPIRKKQSAGEKASSSMFFIAPVKNKQNRVIAVIARHIDPLLDFSRLTQLGRISQSGETYAFDRYGKLLTQSRFDEELRRIGLLGEGQDSVLTVSARDPGGNLIEGFSPSIPRHRQPLTVMAQQATREKSGFNVAGYRDYRGVRAYGAWLWDEKLDIGLATEIGEADALSPYYTTRAIMIIVLGITVLLSLGSLAFAVLIDVRSSRALQQSHDELELRVEERTAELKENQMLVEQSEERFRGYFKHSQVGMSVTSLEKGWIEVNDQLQWMLGYSLDELRRMTWAELTHPDDVEEDLKNFEQMLTGEIDDYALDKRFIRKDGEIVYTNLTVSCLRDENGAVQNILASVMDITERKEAEQALRKSQASARGLLDATQESLLLLDKEGIIIAVNQTAASRQHRAPEELIGTNRFDLLSNGLSESRKAHFNKVLQTGNPEDFEDERDGMVFHHIYYPVQDKAGETIGVAIFAQDITERKHMEKELRRNVEELEQFNKLAIGRELKMIQLKEEINELLGQLGQDEKYEIVE